MAPYVLKCRACIPRQRRGGTNGGAAGGGGGRSGGGGSCMVDGDTLLDDALQDHLELDGQGTEGEGAAGCVGVGLRRRDPRWHSCKGGPWAKS